MNRNKLYRDDGHKIQQETNSNFRQRTIPEMFSEPNRHTPENSMANAMERGRFTSQYGTERRVNIPTCPISTIPRHGTRYPTEYVSEQATALSSPGTSYYSPMNAGYEGQAGSSSLSMPRQQNYWKPQSYRETEQHFYYEEDTHPQRYHPKPTLIPQKQPYYGVPGFYAPNYNDYGDPIHSEYRLDKITADVAPQRFQVDDSAYINETSRYSPPHYASSSENSLAVATNVKNRMAPSAPAPGRYGEHVYSAPVQSRAATPRKRPAETVTTEIVPNKKPVPIPNKKPVPILNKKPVPTEEVTVPATPPKAMIKNSGLKLMTQKRQSSSEVHFFSGPISQVLKWENLREIFPVLLEVIAPLKAKRDVGTHHELLLRDQSGPVLHVQFYEIDRKLPQIEVGQIVRVVGHLTGRGRMQAFSVRISSAVEAASLQRIAFVCQQAAMQVTTKQQETS